MTATRTLPNAKCPIRPGDACSLCQPGVTGPRDCGLVYLVMSDPDLRAELDRVRREGLKESRRTERPATSHEGPTAPPTRARQG